MNAQAKRNGQGRVYVIGDFDTILTLVGTLDDSPGEGTPRERFRGYLETSLTQLGAVRDAVHTCVTHSGLQYARGLQDLVNHIGGLMGFEVEYGRYAGVVGKIGHDGLWRNGPNVVVVEVKTTDAYTINTATLLNYTNDLRSSGVIKPEDDVIGLYVYAKTDPAVKQLEHAIIAEKRTQELRVASADAVLSLAELVTSEQISRDEAIGILWPSGVWVDDIVTLLTRMAAGTTSGGAADLAAAAPSEAPVQPSPTVLTKRPTTPPVGDLPRPLYVLTPVADIPEESARETLERLLPAGVYAFGVNTPQRSKVQAGDKLAFYQTSVGVVADAVVETAPEYKPMPIVKNAEHYPWTFKVRDVRMYLDNPLAIDAATRSGLDAFEGKAPDKGWAWFVQATRLITEHDYRLLTRTELSKGVEASL